MDVKKMEPIQTRELYKNGTDVFILLTSMG